MLDFLDKRVLFVMGKGGVGKSTVATALGIRATLEGKRTIICEVSASENTSRLFRQEEVGYREVELANDLWAISIDPDDSMREYVLLQLKVKAMRDLLFRSRMFTYLAEATPGLNELVTIGKVWELAQLDRKVRHGRKYDLVIVDAPATGHGITFLRTPRTFARIAKVGPMYNQANELDRMVTDHETTGALIVSLPEEMPAFLRTPAAASATWQQAPTMMPPVAAQPRLGPPASVCPTAKIMSGPGVTIRTTTASR